MIFISIDDIFNLLNLLLRIALAVYIIRRYIVARLKNKVVKERQITEQLKQQHIAQRKTFTIIERNIAHEEINFKIMHDKFVRWSHEFQKIQNDKQEECQLRQHKIEQSCKIKMENMQRDDILKTQVLSMMQDTTVEIEKKFHQDTTRGKQYIDKLLQAIGE